MNFSNILMFHRIQITSNQNMNLLYFKRKMVCSIENLFVIIDSYLKKGYQFGSIEQCFLSKKYFHLTFDDGFKEHLSVAYALKEKYQLQKQHASFCINFSNSFSGRYTGMDIIYAILEQGELQKFCDFLKTPKSKDIKKLKLIVARLPPTTLYQLSDAFSNLSIELQNCFLSENQIKKLSEHFQIASHGITHRFLTYHLETSKNEILQSKKMLQEKLNKTIEVFCYPEGKNNLPLQNHCKSAGYQFALSIRHEKNNPFCIGRKNI